MKTKLIPAIALLVLGAACKEAPAPPAEAPVAVDPVMTVVAVAKAIDAMPEKTDSILTANNFTEESYREKLREIASDSAASARYSAAMQ